ncbi:MAG TPA: penicillin-insensitive murein endopeptidase [Sandaracinaceae bacterium LLY-WYZ-13_1]|nr:penicillin-insensitive murein endopeptidase [Sandaracinaceae bacterium LLY-WYZ-13_1]
MARRAWIGIGLLTAVLLSGTASADGRVHVVVAGESLGALAGRYGVTVEQLRRWNDLDDDTIRVGQELTVGPGPTVRYRTVPGDTLGCIAQRFGVPLPRLLEDNPHVSARRLEVGQTLVLRGGEDPREADARAASTTVTVERGDTLSGLAARHGVSVARIAAANEGLDADARLVAGAELTIPVAPTVLHEVSRGETLSAIAQRYGVTVARMRRWNPEVRPDRLRVGARLRVRPARRSESVGAAFCGHVVGSVPVGRHPAYVLRDPERSWATARTVARLRRGFDAVRRAHPRAARVRVHDLSLRGGGPIDDHRSHQSGRDVDITYFQRRGCGRAGCPLERVDPDELDVRRQWTLLRHWLRRGEVEAIFVDYALQAPLYREARRRGATAAQLRAWFQYPRGRWHDGGRIRHFPNHRDHLHVRFACADDEPRCR